MNEDIIRQIIREEIASVLNEGPSVDLVDYDTFRTEFAIALRKAGAPRELANTARQDPDHIIERAYDELKQELTELDPADEFSGIPDIVGWTCKEVVNILGGDSDMGDRVAMIMTGWMGDD